MHAVNILLFPIMLQQESNCYYSTLQCLETISYTTCEKKIETCHPNIRYVLCTVEVLTLAFLCKNLDYKPQSICVQ